MEYVIETHQQIRLYHQGIRYFLHEYNRNVFNANRLSHQYLQNDNMLCGYRVRTSVFILLMFEMIPNVSAV